ncbi:MAG: hypothetical protein AAGD88_06645 [Bacteroidota bacterium]
MKYILLILLFAINGYSQHTERLKVLVENVERDSVQKDTSFLKNGNINYLEEKSFYTFEDIIIETYSGETKVFYTNGITARHDMQDEFGHWLWSKYYNRKGILTKEWVVTKIDTRAKSLKDFFSSRNHLDSEKMIKHYHYSKKSDELYTYKIEYLTSIDGVNGGKVDFLNEKGQILRTKILKQRKPKRD